MIVAKRIELSRAISHALRHDPDLYELELDEKGSVPVEDLLQSLRSLRPEWTSLTVADLQELLSSFGKKRHVIEHGRIRALYGHSSVPTLTRVLATPPPLLFHGTSAIAAVTILIEGLKPMGRHFVHLSVDRETAERVGMRKGDHPVIFAVDAGAAAAAAIPFYSGNDKVWLADVIPARFLSVAGTVAPDP
jgi:putative RNA 2'-phosphotransferase